MELWRIGGSATAPRFNIVSKPNDWAKAVTQAARAIDEGELSDTRTLQLAYWAAFQSTIARTGGAFSGNRTPQPQGWMNYPVGRTGFTLSAVMIRRSKHVRAELYISNADAKSYFFLLRKQQNEVHAELGYSLIWEELPGKQDTRVSVLLDGDPHEETDWPRQHAWLAERLNDLRRVFANRIRLLDASAWQTPEG